MRLSARNTKLAIAAGGLLLVTVVVLSFASCRKEAETPPAVTWIWNSGMPAGVSVAYACAPEGPFLFGTYDGSIRKTDGVGNVHWEVGEPQAVVTMIDADSAGAVVLAAIEPTSAASAEIPNSLRVLGDDGGLRWRVDGPVPGAQVGGSVSADGAKVLVYTAAAKGMPALVSVRDSATGSVRWAKQTENAKRVAGLASNDFGVVVVGYEILAPDEKKPDGLVEAYEGDSIRTHEEFNNNPIFPSLVTTTTVFFADTRGRLSAYGVSGDGLGDRLWRKSAGKADVVLSAGSRMLVAGYETKGKGDKAKEVTRVRIFAEDGKRVFDEKWEAPYRYVPSLSEDGKHLALVPARQSDGAMALIVHLDEEPTTVELSERVTVVAFGCGDGRMLVGTADGLYGIASIPEPPAE